MKPELAVDAAKATEHILHIQGIGREVCVCLKCALFGVVPFFATDPNSRYMTDRDAASAAKRGSLRCHWRHEQLSVRMAVAAVVHHSGGRTTTEVDAAVQVGGCVEMLQVMSQERIKEHTVDGPLPQIVTGTVVEQTGDEPVSRFRKDWRSWFLSTFQGRKLWKKSSRSPRSFPCASWQCRRFRRNRCSCAVDTARAD